MRTVVLKDSEWLRGTGSGELRDPETSKMCCLGVCLRDMGVSEEILNERILPSDLLEDNVYLPPEAFDFSKQLQLPDGSQNYEEQIANLNDDNLGLFETDQERVKELEPLFQAVGIKIEFRPDL